MDCISRDCNACPAGLAIRSFEGLLSRAAMDAEREHVRRMGIRLRELFAAAGGKTVPGDTQIVPLTLGGDQDALDAAEKFQAAGMLVFAIRPPTVPQGTSRLRFSLSAAHSMADIEAIGRVPV